jgi:hypothetical protein
LGNLTLTAYNSELSNDPWSKKRIGFAASHLELNREIAINTQWTPEEIEKRGEALAERAKIIWPALGGAHAIHNPRGMKNMVPITVQLLGEIKDVSSWREVAQLTLETIAELSPESFSEVATLHPSYLASNKLGMRSARQLKNGWFMETNLDSNTLYRLAERAARRAELGIDEWKVEFRPA